MTFNISRKIQEVIQMICYLYTFPNGKKYCGITKNSIEQRASGRYKGQRVGYAIEKYGWENVTKEVILESDNEDIDSEPYHKLDKNKIKIIN